MGAPDYAQCRLSKERTRAFSSWTYGVEMVDENLSYHKNSWIKIMFGHDGRVSRADAVNIQGIANQAVSGQ